MGKPAGLETDGVAHKEPGFPVAVPETARNGRWIASKSWLDPTQPGRMRIPPEPPVAIISAAERPAAVKGAPAVGAAVRTLDGEDRSAIR